MINSTLLTHVPLHTSSQNESTVEGHCTFNNVLTELMKLK